MIKTGMNNKQMKKIAMKAHGKNGIDVPKSGKRTVPNVRQAGQATYSQENSNVGLKKNSKQKKWTAAQDERADRKAGIKEGSPKDIKLDQERGVKDKKSKKKSTVMIQPSHRGLLHRKLGVPEGKKIPEGKLNAAMHSKSPSERKEANFAKNFGH